MRKSTLFCLATVLSVMISCQTKTETVPVDTEAEKAAIATMLDKFNAAFNAKDIPVMSSVLADDVLCLGTDPSEFIRGKAEITDLWTQTLADTALKVDYKYDQREIRVAADGATAIVIEQYRLPFVSTRLSLRNIYQAVKKDSVWMLDFMSWNFIHRNEDIPKLDKALE